MTLCYLGLGSNLNAPKRQLKRALRNLHLLPRTSVVKVSKTYVSRPLGVRSQPVYYNIVVAIQTNLSPHRLLKLTQTIEQKQQRIHKIHWGARTVDIDLLLYGDRTIQSPLLTIPHPQMLKRDFVLVPLLEIAPHVVLPNHDSVASCLNNQQCETYICHSVLH